MGNTQNAETTVTDLDAIMKEGLQQFEINTDEDDPGSVAAAPAADADQLQLDSTAGKTQEEIATEEEAKTFRFTSHAEAERGYKDQQREVTALREKINGLETKEAERAAADAKAAAEAAGDQDFLDFATQRRGQALDEIDALDPDAPDYRNQVSAAYARADRDIFKKSQQPFQPAAAPSPGARETPAPPPDTVDAQDDDGRRSVAMSKNSFPRKKSAWKKRIRFSGPLHPRPQPQIKKDSPCLWTIRSAGLSSKQNNTLPGF
jgi:hypothetical protein